MNYYERHIGDYLKDTAHLSLLEHGVYARLLDVYYTREGALAEEEIARLVGARTAAEKTALEAVLCEFFVREHGVCSQPRCDREIERYQARVAHNQRVGKLGGRPRKPETHAEPEVNPPGYLREPEPNPPSLQSPVSIHQSPLSPPTKAKPSTGERASRLSPEWEPGDRGRTYAAEQGLTNGQLVAELENFRDHWKAKPGKDGTALDWDAKWRTWVRRSRDFRRGPPRDEESIRAANAAANDGARRLLFGEPHA